MGLAQVRINAVAGAAALPNQGCQPTGSDGDSNASGVGDAPTGLLIPADGAFGLGDTANGDRLPLPAVKAKDAVRLSHRKPSLDIGDFSAALLPLADVGPIKRGGQGSELHGGEAGVLSLRGFRFG
jgi:hypothetical protein